MEKILIELDALLDTRLGTLTYMGIEHADRIIDNGYREREHDRFDELDPSLDIERYRSLYKKRSGEILRLSRMTNIIPVFQHISQELAQQAIYTPFRQDIRVEINTYPFDLADDVANEICAYVGYMFSLETEVSHAYIPYEQLTPEFIDQNYASLFIYDFNAWIERHIETLKETKLTRVSFIAPALYVNQKPDEEDLIDDEIGTIDPFANLEMILSEYLTLHLVKPYYFSLIDLSAT